MRTYSTHTHLYSVSVYSHVYIKNTISSHINNTEGPGRAEVLPRIFDEIFWGTSCYRVTQPGQPNTPNGRAQLTKSSLTTTTYLALTCLTS